MSAKLKTVLLFIVTVLASMVSLSSYATNCSVPTPILTMPATITVDDQAPVPSILGSWQTTVMNINCFKDTYYEWDALHRLYTSLAPAGMTVTDGGVTYNVFQTGQPGVGIAIGFQNYDTGAWESLTSAAATNALTVTSNQIRKVVMIANQTGGAYNTAANFKVAFVKTSTVRNSFNTGALTVVNYYPVWYGRARYASDPLVLDTTKLVYSNIQISAVQFNVTPPSCSVSVGTQNQTVTLKSVAKAEFTGVGSTLRPMSFNIQLVNCNKLPLVTMTLSGTADGDLAGAASKGVLKVTSATASGVGIQVMNNQSGTAVPFPLNSAQYLGTVVGTGVNDSFTIPMIAQYIQTKTAISGGLISAAATVTLTYQ